MIGALDAFLANATDAVSSAQGVVISYLGAGFLVTFNAPVAVENPANAALRSASALLVVARSHGFQIRTGIASGELVTGTIGTEARQSFTVYGDAVDLAARLEGQCKEVGLTVLVEETTRSALSAGVPLKRHGWLRIRGLEQSVAVYGLMQSLGKG